MSATDRENEQLTQHVLAKGWSFTDEEFAKNIISLSACGAVRVTRIPTLVGFHYRFITRRELQMNDWLEFVPGSQIMLQSDLQRQAYNKLTARLQK